MAPLISHVYELGLMEAISIPQTECFHGNSDFPVIGNNMQVWIEITTKLRYSSLDTVYVVL